jgi:3',5'-cyclic AMP phosphodiesterase CpdA
MAPFRVLQISDTHLSAERPWFVQNFDAVVRIAAARRPDLVLNTGDISLDGVNHASELGFARHCHDAFDVPFRFVPGNHDLGDNPWRADLDSPITAARRDRYREFFGEDYWRLDAGGWLLVGANAQLFGSDLTAADDQWAFLTSTAAHAAGRPVALFIHKPLFQDDPEEADVTQRYVTPDARRRLVGALAGANVRLVASGHVHQHRQLRVGGVDHCWAPSTAFVLSDRRQPRIGTKRVGFVEYAFHPDSLDVTVAEPAELTNHDLDEFAWLPARCRQGGRAVSHFR